MQAWELEFRSSTSIKQNNSYLIIIIIDIVIHAFNPSAKEQRKVAPGASLENQCRQNGEPQIQGISKVKYNREKIQIQSLAFRHAGPRRTSVSMYMCHTPTHHTHSSNTHRRLYAVPLETIILSPIPRICDLAFRQEEFKSGPAQRSLNPASEVHAVFSNRDLPSTSGEVTKGNSDRLYSWRVSCTTLNNNKPYLVLRFIWGGWVFDSWREH